jgi:hypothetical protein
MEILTAAGYLLPRGVHDVKDVPYDSGQLAFGKTTTEIADIVYSYCPSILAMNSAVEEAIANF